MKTLSKKQLAAVSLGNLGHGLLTGLVMSWLIYFFNPTVESGIAPLLPSGTFFFGLLTALGLIKALGHVFDAITDPFVASRSDRSTNPHGRRLPFMRKTAIPFGLLTALVFISPVAGESIVNALFLALMLYTYYFVFTLYIVPYNALLPELVTDDRGRVSMFTMTSLTFILGTGLAYLAPFVKDILAGALAMNATDAWRLTIAVLAVLAIPALLSPVWALRDEKQYVKSKPSAVNMKDSIKQTFKYRDFRVFVIADLVYFIALAFFQAAMGYYVTVLLKMDEAMSTPAFIITMVISVCFYPLINLMARKLGKKKTLLLGFTLFTIAYVLVALFGMLPLPTLAQAGVAFVIVALPLGIFGILPNAVVSDLAEHDTRKTGETRQGMFFATRSFVFKLGQSVAFLVIPTVAAIGAQQGALVGETGVRLTAVIAAVFCAVGLAVFALYNEKRVRDEN